MDTQALLDNVSTISNDTVTTNAKEFLKAYFVQVQKYGFEYNEPSEYEVVRAKTPNESTVMLIDAVVTKKDLKK